MKAILTLRAGLCGALALIIILSVSCSEAPAIIRMGTEGAYPPYSFINEEGEVDGFERELGDELCRRAELECTWVTNEWDTIIPNLVNRDYDTILAGMSITDERDKVIDFTQAYFPPSPSLYVARAGASVDVVKGVVATQVNTVQADHLAGTEATLVEFATIGEAVDAVLKGDADAALADNTYLKDVVAESDGELIFVGPEVVLDGGVGMGVRESDGELKTKMNEAIDSMKSDGSLNNLIKKWFGEDAQTF